MILNDKQREQLKRLALGSDGPFLRELLDAYILEIKDDCVTSDLSKEAAREAIQKIAELRNKLDVLSGSKTEPSKKEMFR